MYQRLQPSLTKRRTSLLAVCLAILSGLLAGCQSQPADRTSAAANSLAPSKKPVPVDVCSDNMHDLAGYLLQYYVLHREFPERLEDLQPLVDADRKLPLACPVSQRPYLYFPAGLRATGETRRLVVVDPAASHDGKRWAVISLEPGAKQPLGLWVVLLEEKDFLKYQLP